MDLVDILKLQPEEQIVHLCQQKDEHKKGVVEKYLNEYNGEHEILKKENKVIHKNKATQKTVPVAKLVVSLQKKIVRFASGFLFGKPVKYVLNDEKYEDTYNDMDTVFRANKINYFNRKLARVVMSETHAAELWYAVDSDNGIKLRVMLLADSLKDELYPHCDAYGDMDAFTR